MIVCQQKRCYNHSGNLCVIPQLDYCFNYKNIITAGRENVSSGPTTPQKNNEFWHLNILSSKGRAKSLKQAPEQSLIYCIPMLPSFIDTFVFEAKRSS